MTMRKTKRGQRGITLIETMIALAVLAIGIAAVFGMVVHVSKANRTMLLQTRSGDAFAQLAAEIQNAKCDFNPDVGALAGAVDPGIDPTLSPFTGPTGSITYVGTTDGTSLPATIPIMQISYTAQLDGAAPVPAIDFEITIQELNPDGQLGNGVRVYPLRKLCNARLDETSRGEFL